MTVAYLSPAQRKAQAQSAVLAHHAGLQQVLDERAGVLAAAVASGAPADRPARLLHAFLTEEVLPHAAARERGLYRAGEQKPRTELLVRALVSEHRALAWRAGRLLADTETVAVAATAAAIRSLFAVHVAKENYLLLPARGLTRRPAGSPRRR